MFKSEKIFSLFDYGRGHCQVLFRGSSDKDGFKNTDIVFGDVYYLELPTVLYGLEIKEIELTKYIIKKFRNSQAGLRNARLFKVYSMGEEFLVGSYQLVFHYNNFKHPDTSFNAQDPDGLHVLVGKMK